MPYEAFDFEPLNRRLLDEEQEEIIADGYFAMRGIGDGELGASEDFIVVGADRPISSERCTAGRSFQRHQLKFHVSLPEDDGPESPGTRVQYATGWNIVKNILIAHGVFSFKVAHRNVRMSAGNGSQRGKDITIETRQNAEKTVEDWQVILTEITEQLVAAGIPPGYETIRTGRRADREIPGSRYISMRYETSEPSRKDHAAYFRIEVVGQADNRPWRVAEAEAATGVEPAALGAASL